MKLGNRKVVIGGLTAIAFTSLTAFTNVTPDTTSDTNLISATPSVLYQNLAMAQSAGISNYDFSSLFMPGQVTTTLDTIIANSTLSGSKNPVNAQAGIAKLFTQSITLEALGTVTPSDSEGNTTLSKVALKNDSVGEQAEDTTQVNGESASTNLVTGNDDTTQDTAQDTIQDTAAQDTTQDTAAQDIIQDTAAQDTTQDTAAQDTTQDTAQDTTQDTTQSPTSQNLLVEAPIEEVATSETSGEDATTEEVVAQDPSDTTQQDQAATVETEEIEAKQTEEKAVAEESEWANKVMANVEESVNIRAEANEEGEVVGKLYKGAEADIIEKGDVWTKISSGSVEEGYVKNEFLAFGDEAEALAEQEGKLVATVTTDALRIRSEASEDASVLDLAENGEELTAIAENGDWVEIQYTEDTSGFIASEFVSVEYVLGKAITIEEEEAINAEKARKEAEAKQALIAASEEAALLAAVVRMEAGGESYEGKLAVASVVVNRVRSGGYPNSVSGVVYQSGQFPGASNGTLEGFLSSGVGGDSKKAAVEALSGITNVDYLHFNSVSRIGAGGYVIGNHCFY